MIFLYETGDKVKVTKEDLATVAHLSRLSIDADEEERYIKDLNDIVVYVDKLSELPTENVLPTTYALPVENVFRDDTPRPSLTNEEALANAPESDDGYFKVPRVLEE